MDRPEIHTASPVQANFSIWRANARSREFATHWLNLCARRSLVSDDLSRDQIPELPGFRGHRHDQALLSLCCIKDGIAALELSIEKPAIDTRHPSQVSRMSCGEMPLGLSLPGALLRLLVRVVGFCEQIVRRRIQFGKTIQE